MQVQIDDMAHKDYVSSPIKPYERQRLNKPFEFSSINEESKQPYEKNVLNKFQEYTTEKDLNLES